MKKRIHAHRPFHNTAYDCTIMVDPDLKISAAQYRKITEHHRDENSCKCRLELTDDDGNCYGILDKSQLFEV